MSNEIKGTVATVGNISGTLSVASGFDGESAYEVAVKNGFEGTEAEWLESLHGESGVYVGTGDMPEDCNVQIDPNGEVFVVDQNYSPTSTNPISGKGVMEALAQNGIECSASGTSILLTDSSNYPLENLKVYGKSTQDGTPTPEAPIDIVSAGASGSVEVKVCGANLFNAVGRKYDSHDGTKAEVLDNGKIIKCVTTEKGEQWAQCGSGNLNLIVGQQYTVVLDNITSTHKSSIELRNGKGKNQGFGIKPYTFTAQEGCTYTFRFIVNSTETNQNATVTATYEGLRIIAGDTVVPWEEYKEPQTLTLATPNELGLNAVGDYADYIDLEKGVRVQNYAKRVYTGEENVKISGYDFAFTIEQLDCDYAKPIICSHFTYNPTVDARRFHITASSYSKAIVFVFGNSASEIITTAKDNAQAKAWFKAQYDNGTPVVVYYHLAEPIEHTLSAEEIAYYKALHTNYPNTTIFNTDGTNMDVSYVADTKLYIDNKFAELQALALEG